MSGRGGAGADPFGPWLVLPRLRPGRIRLKGALGFPQPGIRVPPGGRGLNPGPFGIKALCEAADPDPGIPFPLDSPAAALPHPIP